MKRNMMACALFISLGIFAWENFSQYVITAVAALLGGYCIWCCLGKKYAAAALAVFSVCVGFFAINYTYSEKMTIAKSFEGREIEISGKVTECNRHEKSNSFDVWHSYEARDKSIRQIKIRVFYQKENYSVQYGDMVALTAQVYIPSGGGGFGDYNSTVASFSENLLLYANCGKNNLTVYENNINYGDINDLAYTARKSICDRIEKCYEGDVSGIIEGITVGKKDNISNETVEHFRKSGLSHMLVVSGMHVNIIVWIMMAFMSLFGIGKYRLTYLFYIAGVWAFVFISGLGVSAIRAAIVASILFLGKIINREADPLNSLGVAAAVMLIANPLVYFSASFRLSVLSTLGILLFSELLKRKLKFLPEVFRETASITIPAQLFVLPLLIAGFGNVGIYGILANIIICPVLTVLVVLILVSLIISEIPFIGTIMIFAVKSIITGIIAIVTFISGLPHAVVDMRGVGGIYLPGYIALLFGIYLFLKDSRKHAKKAVLVSLVFLTAALSVNTFDKKTEITFLSTGNSDCTIMERGELTLMFDGGGSIYSSVAENEIIPYLNRSGAGDVDVAFVTHYHTDHAKGIAELMYAGRVRNVVLPVGIHKESFELYTAAKKTGTPLHFIKDSDKLRFGDIEVEAVNVYDSKEENNGMVYFVSLGKSRVCIAGDIHKNGEAILMEKKKDISCTILKVPHHGSDTSGSEEFIKAVGAKYAIILNGDNLYPVRESEELYEKYGTKLYKTYRCGSIKAILDKEGNTAIYFGRGNFYELRDIKKTS